MSMIVVAMVTTYPMLCSEAHLSHAPLANAVRIFAGAAEDFSSAVLQMPNLQKSLQQQCRHMHVFLYVRALPVQFLFLRVSRCYTQQLVSDKVSV